jgi:DNA-binding transcriptional regulator YiaG
MHWVGYISCTCSKCKKSVDEHLGRTMRLRREYLGLTREQIAKLYGVKKQTIKRYEVWPSKRYWEWLLNYGDNNV